MKQAVLLFAIVLALGVPLRFASAAAPPETDTDKDGLTNRQETLFGTDETNADTDGDGFADGKEVSAGYSPTSTSDARLKKGIWIELKKQQLHQVLGGVVFSSYSVSTGKSGMRTPTGTFKILSKNPRVWSKSAGLWMPWWMAFTSRGHGVHELPEWPGGKKEGANHLGTPVSHGCVRLGVDPAKKLYDWAPIGTPIVITN